MRLEVVDIETFAEFTIRTFNLINVGFLIYSNIILSWSNLNNKSAYSP